MFGFQNNSLPGISLALSLSFAAPALVEAQEKPADLSPGAVSSTTEKISAEEAISKAKTEVERKRFREAKLILKQAIAANATEISLYMELYRTSVKMNDWSDASMSLEKIMEIDPPREKELYADYGQALFKLNRYDKARAALNKALSYGKDRDAIHKTLAQIAILQKDAPAAIIEYKEYLKLKPNDGDMHWDYANLLYKEKKIKESIPEFKAAADFSPRDAYRHGFLAQLLLVEKDFDGAVAEYRKAASVGGAESQNYMEGLRYALQQQSMASQKAK